MLARQLLSDVQRATCTGSGKACASGRFSLLCSWENGNAGLIFVQDLLNRHGQLAAWLRDNLVETLGKHFQFDANLLTNSHRRPHLRDSGSTACNQVIWLVSPFEKRKRPILGHSLWETILFLFATRKSTCRLAVAKSPAFLC